MGPFGAGAFLVAGRYEVLGEVAAGGMGTVYRARDTKLDRFVALKMPHFSGPRPSQDVARKRFDHEAKAVAQLQNDNICPIYDVGEHEGCPFAVLALVEGGSLADVLKEGPLEARRAAELVARV